jgi:hypothetical protein
LPKASDLLDRRPAIAAQKEARENIVTAPDIMSADYESNPWPMLNEIRENHPITFHKGLNSWLLSRFEDVEKVLTSRAFTTEKLWLAA